MPVRKILNRPSLCSYFQCGLGKPASFIHLWEQCFRLLHSWTFCLNIPGRKTGRSWVLSSFVRSLKHYDFLNFFCLTLGFFAKQSADAKKRTYRGCLIWTIANFSNWVGQHPIQRMIQLSTGKENKLQHSWFLELEPELSVTILVSRMEFYLNNVFQKITGFVWRVQTHCFLSKDCLRPEVFSLREADELF